MVETYERLHEQITDRGPWQQTASGNAFYIGDPRAEEVDVRVIARALSRQTRYNGHTLPRFPFYSVAQHCVMVARWMREDNWKVSRVYAGLHHEDAEAYIGDIISQVKKLCPQVKALERKVEAACFEALDVDMGEKGIAIPGGEGMTTHNIVKEYDFIALATEVRDLLPPNQSCETWGDLPAPRQSYLTPWAPSLAETEFLNLHLDLLKEGATRHDG